MKSKRKSYFLSFVIYPSFVVWIMSVVILVTGCDAFVRKFTRKKKSDNLPREEMVLAPQEYKPSMDKEQLYRQYFLFWQSWQEELIESLTQNESQKKQIDCAQQAIKNLFDLRLLLNEDRQKKLDVYINRMKELQDSLVKDTYTSNVSIYIRDAESIKRGIFRDFSFNKIKKYLK